MRRQSTNADSDPQGASGPYAAAKARQGRIVLRQPWQKAVMLVALFGAVLAAIAIVAWMAIL